jgi:hypothetical protein
MRGRIYVRKKCLPMALDCQPLYAANSAHRRFVGSFQVSKALDRTRKLHGYRINAYVRLGSKAPFDSLPVSAGRYLYDKLAANYPGSSSSHQSALGYAFMSPRLGQALAVQTPDVPQKVA